jgi:hypothetical protein
VTDSGTLRQDDPSIPSEEDLYRNVLDTCLIREQVSGRFRLTSDTFRDRSEEISVNLSSLVTPAQSLSLGIPRHLGVVAITAGEARQLGQIVAKDPIPENPAHALICGHQTRSIRKQMAETARWVYPLDRNPLT